MPSLRILDWSVVRFIPSLNAAPADPPMIQLVSPRARKMCSRSASSKVEGALEKSAKAAFGRCLNCDRGISSSWPRERITARSITFCISRMSPAHPPREPLGEMAGKHRDVLGALAQGRQHDREYVQAIVEVAAKAAVGDHVRQIAVRCRHQTHVHPDSSGAAQAFELLLL